jgi:sigma-E factor negative regulatory protein RseC
MSEKKFSQIAFRDEGELKVGQQVTVSIPEEALLSGAFMMYMLPLILLFVTSSAVRLIGGGELLQIVSGLLGLITGFVWVKHRMSHHDAGINVKPNEDFK